MRALKAAVGLMELAGCLHACSDPNLITGDRHVSFILLSEQHDFINSGTMTEA